MARNAEARLMAAMQAVPHQPAIRPAFTVTPLAGNTSKVVHLFDKGKNKILSKTIEVPAGFLVTFAKGHSIRCYDKEHLDRIGAGMRIIPLVNEDGDIVGTMPNVPQAVAA